MHGASTGNRKGANRVLVRTPVGKRQLGRPRHTLEYNIKMYLLEAGYMTIYTMLFADDKLLIAQDYEDLENMTKKLTDEYELLG